MGIITEITQSGSGTTSGNYVFVESQTLSSATNTVNFASLDINTDGSYVLIIEGSNDASGANNNIEIFFNEDYTATNYYGQSVIGVNAVISAQRQNSPLIAYTGIATDFCAKIHIMRSRVDGILFAQQYGNHDIGANIDLWINCVAKTSPEANLTHMRITGTQNFSIGSRFNLYKITGE